MDYDFIMKIEKDTEEGKKVLTDLFVNAILNSETETLENPIPIKRNQDKYLKALCIALELQKREMCEVKYDNVLKPYYIHCIFIKWKDVDGYIDIPIKETEKLIHNMDGFMIDTTDPNVWQLSITCYKDISAKSENIQFSKKGNPERGFLFYVSRNGKRKLTLDTIKICDKVKLSLTKIKERYYDQM